MAKKTKAAASNRKKGSLSKGYNNDADDDEEYDHHVIVDGSERSYADSHSGWGNNGNHSVFSMGGSNGENDNLDMDDNDDIDNMAYNDRIIQRGDPGNEGVQLALSNRMETIKDAIHQLCDSSDNNTYEVAIRRCYKVLSLYGTLCGSFGYEIIASNMDDIIEKCIIGLRPQQASVKQYATCRFIEIISILLCNVSSSCMDHWIGSIQESLRRSIITTSRSTQVRIAALRALSITVFMANHCSNGDDNDSIDFESIFNLCETIATNREYRNQIVPYPLRATAYDCWSLLACTYDDWTIAGQDEVADDNNNQFVGRGVAILSHLQDAINETKQEASDYRTSAAECITLIHEARINLGVIHSSNVHQGKFNSISDLDHEIDIEKKSNGKLATMNNSTSRRYQKGSWENSGIYEVIMDEIKQRVVDLANESSHRISKKDKKEQRSNFREYMSTIVDDESPDVTIKFRNGQEQLDLSCWKDIIPLNFLRQSLQSGFQVHLSNNPIVQQLFHIRQVSTYDSSYNTTMSQIEKRLLLSKNSETYKIADQDRHKKRDKRQNIKNHFLTADGEDI